MRFTQLLSGRFELMTSLSIVAGTPVEALLLERVGDFEQSVDYNSRRLFVKVCRPPGSIQLTIRTIQDDSRVPIAT